MKLAGGIVISGESIPLVLLAGSFCSGPISRTRRHTGE
jgi:hypothetical protein